MQRSVTPLSYDFMTNELQSLPDNNHVAHLNVNGESISDSDNAISF